MKRTWRESKLFGIITHALLAASSAHAAEDNSLQVHGTECSLTQKQIEIQRIELISIVAMRTIDTANSRLRFEPAIRKSDATAITQKHTFPWLDPTKIATPILK